jgi:hypothetical protein
VTEASFSTGPLWFGFGRRLKDYPPMPPARPLRPDDPRAGRLRVAWGAYFTRTSSREIELPEPRLVGGLAESGSVNAASDEAGLAVALRPTHRILRRLRLGVAIRAHRVDFDGTAEDRDAEGDLVRQVGLRGQDVAAAFTAGLLLDLIGPHPGDPNSLRLGVSWRGATDWNLDHRRIDFATGVSSRAAVSLVEPDLLAVGLSHRQAELPGFLAFAEIVTVSVEVDWTDDAGVGRALGENASAIRVPATGLVAEWGPEYRAGLEIVGSIGKGGSYAIRGGIRRRPHDVIRATTDDPELALFAEDPPRRVELSVGLSFLAAYGDQAVRFDLDAVADRDSAPRVSFGAAVRF